MSDQNTEAGNPDVEAVAGIRCTGCGYDLRGLAIDGLCPECERPIADSIPRTAPALAATVGRGASWVMLAAAISKGAAMVAQIFLGWLVTDTQFGVFATASAIGWFIGLLKDAGANTILMQRGAKDYEKIVGPLFWMNLTLSIFSALLLAAVAYPIGVWQGTPAVAWILLVIAASTPVQAVGGVLQTKLRQDMKFAAYSRIQVISALLRQASTVALAATGFGAMSFAWPWLICAVFEAGAAYAVTGEALWKRRAERAQWPGFARQMAWSMAGIGANFAMDQGPYLILGSIVSKAITGQFYFAFQLTAQVGVLMSFAVQQVLVPVLVRLNHEKERQAEAVVRSLHAMTLSGSIASITLAACIEPLEALFWRGKWSGSVHAIMVLGVFYVWRIHFGLTTAVLHAQGRFKRHAILTVFEGVGLMTACAVGALTPPGNVTSIAIWAGAWLFVARLIVTLVVMRDLGFSFARTLTASIPSWLLSVVAGTAVVLVDHWVGLIALLRQFSAALVGLVMSAKTHPAIVDSLAQALRAGILACGTLVFSLVLVRVLLPSHLRDGVAILPRRLRAIAYRVLLLGALAEEA